MATVASDLTSYPVGTVANVYGEPIEISVITGDEDGFGDDQETAAVEINCTSGGIVLDKAGREQFQRLFMEAERRAEASDAEA